MYVCMRQIYKGKKKLCLSLLLRVRPKVNGSRPNRGAPVFPSPGCLFLASCALLGRSLSSSSTVLINCTTCTALCARPWPTVEGGAPPP